MYREGKSFYMKKVIIILTISISLYAIPACSSDKKGKGDKELSIKDVPESVKSAFSAKYSTATGITWENAHEDNNETYKAKFDMAGKKMKAEFDANGTFVKEDEDK